MLRDLVSFLQFKKREKHPWMSATFSTKNSTPPWVYTESSQQKSTRENVVKFVQSHQ